jgi:hypothetical protein
MYRVLCTLTRGRRPCPRGNQSYHTSAQLIPSSHSVRHRQLSYLDQKNLTPDFPFRYLHSLHSLKACTRIDSQHQRRTTTIQDSAHHGRVNCRPPHLFSSLIQIVRLSTSILLPTIRLQIVHHYHRIIRGLHLSAAILMIHTLPGPTAVASLLCTVITMTLPPCERPSLVHTVAIFRTSRSARCTADQCTATSHATLSHRVRDLWHHTSMDPMLALPAGQECLGSLSSCQATLTTSMEKHASEAICRSSPPRS